MKLKVSIINMGHLYLNSHVMLYSGII